jgi:hypothetical protein
MKKKNMTLSNVMANNKENTDFRDIIMSLRHAYNTPTLESQIQDLAATATVSNRFLIKMEIMKLSRNVQRVIDLRDVFKAGCKKFTYQGISHFLDDKSKNEFENEINKYGGNYTLGVYEHIMQKAKARYQADPHALLTPTKKTETVYLTQFFQRKDERLYFIKKVSVFYNSPEKMTQNVFNNFAIEGLTTNISSTGLSIKIAKEKVRRKDGLIHVWMHGIESEFKFSDHVIITYDIKKTEEKNGYIYFNLYYHNKQFSKVKDEFIVFSERYLNAQKKRNNLPVENTINAVKVKATEQLIIARLSALPVFLLQQNGVWLPAAQFKTKDNSNIGLIANIKDNKDFLRSFSVLPSIQSRIALGERFHDYLFVMPIKDKNNKAYYVAIPFEALTNNSFIKKIARSAYQRNQLKLYRIDGNTTIPETQSHVPSSLPSSAGEAFERMNQQPIDRVKSLSDQLKRMLVFSDFSDAIVHLNLLDADGGGETEINLAQYILKKPVNSIDLYGAFAEKNDLRMEDRFVCKINLLLQQKALQTQEFIPCHTINISTRGLKIVLSTATDLKVGDIVLVHIPMLIGKDHNDTRYQPYHVVGKDSELAYRLFIEGNAAAHDGRKVFKEYINKNINEIQAVGYENEVYGLSRALRNIFANNIPFPYGIVAKEGPARYIKNIATSENAIHPDLGQNTIEDSESLMESELFRTAIIEKIELINNENPFQILYFIVMSKSRSNGDEYFLIKEITEANKDTDLKPLMDSLKCIGKPRLLRIKIAKKERVFDKYFRDEMAYIERFATAKVKAIKSTLRDTIGAFEISDISDLID